MHGSMGNLGDFHIQVGSLEELQTYQLSTHTKHDHFEHGIENWDRMEMGHKGSFEVLLWLHEIEMFSL